MEKRCTFSPRHLVLLENLKAKLESFGYTCTVEVTTMAHHNFELHTLVAVAPKKENPIQFTRAR